jgi:splicing factor 3B subunit 2
MKEKKPGMLSAELVTALGTLENAPPPWLINMQRYGPPPAYPHLRIAGLNAPIPEGASYGYHPGGWGKPPVDEYGRPLYGDVFGTFAKADEIMTANLDRSHWGEIGGVSSESESSEEEEEDEGPEEGTEGRRRREASAADTDASGVETPMTLSGITSVASGLETPDTTVDLRKRDGVETPDTAGQRELYRVIPEKRAAQQGQFYASEKAYAIPRQGAAGDVQLSINPDQLDNELHELGQEETLKDTYESQLRGNRDEADYEDGSNDPRAKRKRRAESGAVAKRHKDFKF